MFNRHTIYAVCLLLVFLLGPILACGDSDESPTQSSEQVVVEQPPTPEVAETIPDIEPESSDELVSETAPTIPPEPTNSPAPTSTPEPTSTPLPTQTPIPTNTPLPFNEIVSFADWEYSISDSSVFSTIGDDTARGAYIYALVQLINNSTTPREMGSNFFLAKDAQGRTYNMNSSTSLEYHQVFGTANWHLDEIAPSGSAIIPIVFDVSPDSFGVVLFAAGTTDPSILLIENVGGDPLALKGNVLESSDWSFSFSEPSITNSIGDELARGVYVTTIVNVLNNSVTTRELGSNFFLMKDGEGRTYAMDSTASLEYHHTYDTDAWHLEEIGPSLIGAIPVTFDVSPDATALSIIDTKGSSDSGIVVENIGGPPLELEGEVFTTGSWDFTIKNRESFTSIDDEVATGSYFVLVIGVKNMGTTPQEFGSGNFGLKDSQGRSYEMDTSASLAYHHTFNTDAWHLEELGPSLIGTVPVAFDVASDASGFVLTTRDGIEILIEEE